MKLSLKLIIYVDYEDNGVGKGVLVAMLGNAAKSLAGNGLFTGETAAEVEGWDYTVTGRMK